MSCDGTWEKNLAWAEHAKLLKEEKAAMIAKIKAEKDDGFVPFSLFHEGAAGMGSPKEGDTVRLKDGIVVRVHHRSGLIDIKFAGVVTTLHLGAIAALRRKPPEPLKVGDFVRHLSWAHGERAEIAGIKDGVAAFWGLESSGTQYVPRPRPLSELERVT